MVDESVDFDRSKIESAPALFVSKWRALPEDIAIDGDQTVWTSGLRTWRKLAARGIWVTGSTESLGESENPRLECIKGPLQWLKLTHEAALDYGNDSNPAMATYRLTKASIPSDLNQKKYFYWTSYSSFKAALAEYPEIRDRHHSCGPGNTAVLIEKELKVKPVIYASYKEWISEFK